MPQFNQSSALLFKRFVEAGITSPEELANVMGNASVETGSFSTMHERMGYRSVGQVIGAVKSAGTRNTTEEIQAAIDSHDPKQMAHILYDNRPDLKNGPDDGWKFHGRGYFQYTGRDNYERFGDKFGYDLRNNPDMAADPEVAAKLAIAYWKEKVPAADRKDAYASGVAINGGENGADARIEQSAKWAKLITPELIKGVQDGTISLDQLATMGNEQKRSGHHHVDGTLRTGDSGDEVANLQTQLGALGYKDSHGRPLQADRSFGPATDSAVKSFQRDHGLTADGIVGPATQKAINEATQAHSQQQDQSATPGQDGSIKRLDDPNHPDHSFFQQTRDHVHRLDREIGRTPNQQSDNIASALTVQARHDGLQRIDQVALSEDGSRLWGVQTPTGRNDHLFDLRTHVPTDAANRSMEQSGGDWNQAMQSFQQQEQHRTQQQAQAQQQDAAQQLPR